MKRTTIFLAGSTLAFGWEVACGFPEVTFDDLTRGDSNNGTLEAGAPYGDASASPFIEGGDSFDARTDRDSDFDARPDAPSCGTCDCDADGFNDLGKAGCEKADGPNDCDDGDARAKPTQSFLPEPANPPRYGDWNCDGKMDILWPENIDCGQFALHNCSGKYGFSDAIACGQTATWVQCAWSSSVVACVATETRQEIQSCR